MLRLFLFLASMSFLHTLSAQTVKSWEELGDEAIQSGNYTLAEDAYREAMLLDSSLFNLTVKYAEALRYNRDYGAALHYYNKAYSKDRGQIYPEGLFWIASMQKHLGEYKDALRNFKKYRSRNRSSDEDYLYQKAEQEIESCTFSLKARRDSSGVIINHPEVGLNSPHAEFSSFFSDSTLFISSDRNNRSMLYCTNNYPLEVDLKSLCCEDSSYQYANFNIGPDGKTVFFSRCKNGQCQIMTAMMTDDCKLIDIQEISAVNRSGYNSTMPFVTTISGQTIMFLSSNQPGSIGKMDIWWSQKGRNGFERPVNAGASINSIDDEITPFYVDRHLYFSSNWHKGFGGFDIFKSAGIPRDFSTPENLGYPFNTNANDFYWTYFPEIQTGFLTSNRIGSYVSEGELCCNDIYSFQFEDSLKVREKYENLEELNDYLPVTLYFHNDEPEPNTRDTTTLLTYEESYKSYSALQQKYLRESAKGLKPDAAEEAQFEIEEFFTLQVDKGMEDLKTFTELLERELRLGSEIELFVKGFASPRAKSDYNLNLTKRRISSLVNYLKEYQNELLLPYFSNTSKNGGKLVITEIPFGEYNADQTVSDALENERESIYSKAASLERKIEIRSVQRLPRDTTSIPPPDFDKLSVDFGVLTSSDSIVSTRFKFKNIHNEVLKIESLETSCECTTAFFETDTIEPGNSSYIEVSFNPENRVGMIVRTILVKFSGIAEPVELVITSEVTE